MAVSQHRWFISVAVVLCWCVLLAGGAQIQDDEPNTEKIVQEIYYKKSGPYESALRITQEGPLLSDDQQEGIDSENDEIPSKEIRVSLPNSLNCATTLECVERYDDFSFVCSDGQCMCRQPMCWVYHYEIINAWSARNVFTCGTCGVLGSWCNETLECDFPGVCKDDGFCHCKYGENENNICLTTDTSWTYKMAFAGLGMVSIITLVMIVFTCYRERPWSNPGSSWSRCFCCSKISKGQARRGSCEKSPAFTVQSHYANHGSFEFATDDHIIESGAVGGALPRHVSRNQPPQQQHSMNTSDNNNNDDDDDGHTTISSVATTATIQRLSPYFSRRQDQKEETITLTAL
ncbi:hypothetical protein Pcinc_035458 [Petrolisthes cinctipes]|uniref:Uncharacterized protein n=1 Tax=Petrolisthes cinctipes TaxID=88211 RepID=A0AAE1BYA4_PETCI|nr:hypothetical protein Pcinc_035458 [Petrolisthes cinctipes]